MVTSVSPTRLPEIRISSGGNAATSATSRLTTETRVTGTPTWRCCAPPRVTSMSRGWPPSANAVAGTTSAAERAAGGERALALLRGTDHLDRRFVPAAARRGDLDLRLLVARRRRGELDRRERAAVGAGGRGVLCGLGEQRPAGGARRARGLAVGGVAERE